MIGLIGGTGLGEALFGEVHAHEHDIDTPFGKPSAPVRIIEWHGLQIATLARHGVGHRYNPSQVPFRANIYALKQLGVTHILASGAVGSLREEMHPRDLVIVDQVIDKTHRRPTTFYDDLAVHAEFAEPFCPALRKTLKAAASRVNTRVHEKGTYVCMEGPAFSTIAESNMHRAWGGDLIGMTVMPEAKLAREAEIAYAMVALVTDYDCWKPHQPGTSKQALLEEIIGHLKVATANAIALLRVAIEDLSKAKLPESPAHSALELGIWSDRKQITPSTWQKYGVLLNKYAS